MWHLDAIEQCAAQFLCDHAAEGSDPGLAIVSTDVAQADREALSRFGLAVKQKIISQAAARTSAATAAPEGLAGQHRPAALPVPPASPEDPAVLDTAVPPAPGAAEPTGPVVPVASVARSRVEPWTVRQEPTAMPR